MIAIPRSKDYFKNEDKVGAGTPCIVCGKAVEMEAGMVHTWEGYWAVTEDEVPALSPDGESGFYPIGRTCIKRHPELRAYVQHSIPV